MKDIMRKVKSYLSSHAVRKKIRAGISIMACVTVFTTTYALLLPALTLETTAACGLEEHQHTDECYEDVLVCGQEESEGHQHSEACYDENGQLICGMEESEGHQHSEDCYERQLVCGKEAHIHTEECYAKDEDQAENAQTEEDEHTADDAQPEEDVHENASDVTSEEEEAVDTAAETGAGSSDDTNGESENKPAESSPAAEPAAVPTEADPASGTEAVLPVGTLEPAKLEKIDFKRFLTEDTTVYYVPENGDKWMPIDDETELVPEQKVLLHFAYKLPEGTINATNAETEYDLPLSLAIKDEEIEKINDEYCTIINGDDREADSLTAAGKFEIKEETNDDDEVIRRYIALDFNQDTYTKNGGVVMTDGTVSSAPEEVEGFFELLVTAEDLLTLEKDENREASFIVHWNDDEDMDTSVRFDEEALDVFLAAKEGAGDDASAESADNAESEDFADGTLTFEGDDYTVTAFFGKTAKLPKGVSLSVSELKGEDYDEYLSQAQEAVGDGKSVKGARFFDITFVTADGEPVEPQDMVDVRIDYHESQALEDSANVEGLHFTDDGPEQIDLETQTSDGDESAVEAVSFQSDAFSVYGVVYTVDFHWEVDGKVFEFGLAGGDTVSLRELVEALHIIDTGEEDIDKFIEGVESVAFSDESLIKVAPITEDTTAGDLKDNLGLESEYSAELSEERIETMDSKVLNAPDWALISLKAFDSVQTLSVTMKTGEVFTIAVTDAQIIRDFISASGDTYTITVTYDDDAGIPDGADLKVREILSGSVEEAKYISESAFELGLENSDISDARFFDIEIVDAEGQKIEPKTTVDVKIEYKDPVEISKSNTLSVVHFADEGTEIISDVSISDNHQMIEYKQDSFSITGTIVSPEPQSGSADNPRRYMILVQYEGKYYIVNNDASLTEVSLNNDWTVNITDPMMWSYEDNHIYYPAEAVGFTSQDVASDYLYRYLNASAEENEKAFREEKNNGTDVTTYNSFQYWCQAGWRTENTDGPKIDNRAKQPYQDFWGRWHCNLGNIENRNNRHLWDEMSISYNNNHLHHGDKYLGIEFDEDGVPIRLVGSQSESNAANIVFASANSVPGVDHNNHTVNHIDISITGKAQITVPLAYGTYYYEGDDGQYHEYVVSSDTDVTLTKEKIDIEPEDMKGATIKAFDKDGNELDNAFVVTGYSSNAKTDYSTPQVRIEGQFKVANLPRRNVDENNDYDPVKNERLQNIITYSVSANKPITFPVVDTEHGYGQLYEKQKDGSYKKVELTVDIGMSASFNYWDEDNECPPLQPDWGFANHWRKGGIPDHNMSGMDFKLGGNADEEGSKMVALEITKMVLDENHHMIHLDKPYEQTFKVYGSNQNKHGSGGVDDYHNVVGKNVGTYTEQYNTGNKYTELHSKEVSVGESGMGLVFDYDVEPNGMYYIAEDTNDVPKTIVDANDQEWTYAYTYIETEYVWRNDGYSGRHESDRFTDLNSDSYESMPEVAGSYTGSHDTPPNGTYVDASKQNSPGWRWYNEKRGVWEEGNFWNGFLEYYVYNVYTQGTKLDVVKEWNTDIPENAEITAELYYALKMVEDKDGHAPDPAQSFPASYDDYQKVEGAKIGSKSIFEGVTTEVVLKAGSDWKNTFEKLPITVTDAEGNIYEVDYYAKEKSVKIPGEGKTVIDDSAQDITGRYKQTIVKTEPADEKEISDGTVTITNEKEKVKVTVEKVWEPALPDGASITVELHRYAPKKDGIYTVTVQDQYGAAVPGATIELYKGEEKIGTYTTDQNGQVTVSGLKPGTYTYKQTAAPNGYQMASTPLEADSFVVEDNKTVPQSKIVVLENEILKSAGIVTLTVKDNKGAPISGAVFDLYKEGQPVEGRIGLISDDYGAIVVNGLDTGKYKFVQTSTPDAYKMPGNNETSGFEVIEKPGEVQTFDQTMTNNLKGKGTVTIKLTEGAENGAPISGVKFQLLKDGSEVASGFTDSSGQVIFGGSDKLDEGSYVIHQATAKNGFDRASDQQFTIVEGDPDQTIAKSFINEKATGNVNLNLMRKFDRTTGDQWLKIGNTITGLKPGTTYTIKATTKNVEMVKQNHLWYFEAEGTYSTGNTPNQSNISSVGSIDTWTVDGNTATKLFSFTPSKNDTTYTIALITDWSVNDLNLEIVKTNTLNTFATSAGRTLRSKSSSANRLGESNDGTLGAAVNFTDATPAEAPEGYADDSSFKIEQTITGSTTSYTFPEQDKYDADGNEYKYYVIETAHEPDDFAIKSYEGDPLSETGTIRITNERIPKGGLTITKEVTVNGGTVPETDKTIADGTYTFSITGPNNYTNTVSIKVTQGVAEQNVVLTGLEPGDYVITETGSTNVNGISLAEPQTITVAPGSQSSQNIATFVNNLETTELNVNKLWASNSPTDHPTIVYFKVYRAGYYTDGEEVKPASEGFYPDESTTFTINGNATTTISNLPVNGTEVVGGIPRQVTYEYRVVEMPVEGNVVYWPSYTVDGTNTTIINTPVEPPKHETSLSVKKNWIGKDGQPADAAHASDEIEFTLKQIPHNTGYVPVTVTYINADGSTWKTQELFVEKGAKLNFTFNKGWTVFSHYIDISVGSAKRTIGGQGENYTFETNTLNSETIITAQLEFSYTRIITGRKYYDRWGDIIQDLDFAYQWTSSVTASEGTLYTDYNSFYNAMAVDSTAGEASQGIYSLGKDTFEKISGTYEGSRTGDWAAAFNHLPQFQKVGNDYVVYTYEIEEIKIKPQGKEPETVGTTTVEGYQGESTGYLVNWTQNGTSWSVTNTEKPGIDIDIKKVNDKDEPLGDAVFEIYKSNGTVFEKLTKDTVEWLDQNDQFIVTKDGFTMTDLADGIYQIKEVKAPAGYVITESIPVTFTVSGGKIVEASNVLKNGAKYEKATKTTKDAFIIPNTPGAPLPHTGGPGTALLSLSGIMLTLLAGVGMLLRRKIGL